MSDIKLEPCPVCGTKGTVVKIRNKGRDYFYGTCRNKYCPSDHYMTEYRDTPEQAAMEWNRMVLNE